MSSPGVGWRPSMRLVIPAAIILCVGVAAITFLRFLVTPLGLGSLGRDWGYFVSYADFGFIRRGLIGTFSDVVFGPVANHRLPHLVLYPAFLIAILLIALLFIRRLQLKTPQHQLYAAVLLLSPAFLGHFAYSTGDFNVVLAAIFIASMLLLNRFWAVIALTIVGILVHEIFVLAFVPALCVAMLSDDEMNLRRASAYGALAAAALIVVLTFGIPDLTHDQYLQILDAKAPNLPVDGYFEITNGVRGNAAFTWKLYQHPALWVGIIPALIYWAVIAISFFPRDGSLLLRLGYVGAAVTPLLMFALGSDLYRWVSMAAVATIVLGGHLADRRYKSLFSMRPWLVAALTLPWFLLGPFGSACDPDRGGCVRAFPMAQFVLERI
jgi:hypothetical protein